MEPLGTELFNMSAASYERTFWVPGTNEKGEETIVRDRRVQSFPETMEIEDGCESAQASKDGKADVFQAPSVCSRV
jgi:hypothetical protein